MQLSSIPAGTEILVDANILIYALTRRSAESMHFLQRCAAGEISGFTTLDVLADTCHRLMLYEAFRNGSITRQNASSLKGKRTIISGLHDYWQMVRSLHLKGIAILPLDEHRFHRAHALRVQHGLMTNDSILLAARRRVWHRIPRDERHRLRRHPVADDP